MTPIGNRKSDKSPSRLAPSGALAARLVASRLQALAGPELHRCYCTQLNSKFATCHSKSLSAALAIPRLRASSWCVAVKIRISTFAIGRCPVSPPCHRSAIPQSAFCNPQ